MKVEELMIGDYVYNHRNWECPIVEIHKNSALVIAKHYGEEEFLLSDLEPIPLTAEILEKNGFNEDNKEINNKSDLVYRCSCGDVIGIDIWSGRGYIEDASFEYVHQLQHALRLLGIEKEFVI